MYCIVENDSGLKRVAVFLPGGKIPFLFFEFWDWGNWTEIKINARLDLVRGGGKALEVVRYFLDNTPTEFTTPTPADLKEIIDVLIGT